MYEGMNIFTAREGAEPAENTPLRNAGDSRSYRDSIGWRVAVADRVGLFILSMMV
jgi:hypothetical protein